MHITREFYRPAKDAGYVEYKPNLADCTGYKEGLFECWVNFERKAAMFFTGKQSKPTWNYRFPSEDSMKKEINDTISNILSWEQHKIERKEKAKKEVDDVKVGDLFCYSWGYEQTNVEFFQCIEKKGKKMVFRPIASREEEGSMMSHGMANNVIAVKDKFLKDMYPGDDRFEDLVKMSLTMPFGCLYKTDEKTSHYQSWYA